MVANVISQVHDTIGAWNPGSGWTPCAVSLQGGTNRYVVANTYFQQQYGRSIASVVYGVARRTAIGAVEIR